MLDFGTMEISRQQAVDFLKRWKRNATTVGLHFAARGGTAGSTMLAKVADVSSRIVFENDSGILRFSLYKARFAYGPVLVLRTPSRAGLVEIDGLHIWLESGHWLFICDGKGLGQEWLLAKGVPPTLKGTGGLLESQQDVSLAY